MNISAKTPFRTWLIAVRPFAYTASVSTVLLGLGLLVSAGHPVCIAWFLATVVGVVLLHTGANLLNDLYDFRRGLDTEATPFSGALVRGLLTEQQVLRAAISCLAGAVVCAGMLATVAPRPVLWLGGAGVALALFYTRPGRCLKFAGMGDVAIFAAFGPLPVLGTWWVQTGRFSWEPVSWGVPLGLLATAILHANNWRDSEADASRGCRTLAARLGTVRSASYYRLLVLLPFALVLVGWLSDRAPWPVLVTGCALPSALRLIRQAGSDTGALATLDAATARLHILFSVLLVAGFVAGRFLSA